jgi:thioredoxin reductase
MTPGAAQFEEATFSEADLHGRELRTDLVWRTTSVPGIFACGDVRSGPIKRVASAVGEGSLAIALVHQYLREADATPASVVAATSSVSAQ